MSRTVSEVGEASYTQSQKAQLPGIADGKPSHGADDPGRGGQHVAPVATDKGKSSVCVLL